MLKPSDGLFRTVCKFGITMPPLTGARLVDTERGSIGAMRKAWVPPPLNCVVRFAAGELAVVVDHDLECLADRLGIGGGFGGLLGPSGPMYEIRRIHRVKS